jgi:hypothetical protein
VTTKTGQYRGTDNLVQRNYTLRMLDEETYRITTTEDIAPTEFYLESGRDLGDGIYEVTAVGKFWNKTEYDTLLQITLGKNDIINVQKQPLPQMRTVKHKDSISQEKLTDIIRKAA